MAKKKKRSPIKRKLIHEFSTEYFPPRQRFLGLERKRFENILSDFFDKAEKKIQEATK